MPGEDGRALPCLLAWPEAFHTASRVTADTGWRPSTGNFYLLGNILVTVLDHILWSKTVWFCCWSCTSGVFLYEIFENYTVLIKYLKDLWPSLACYQKPTVPIPWPISPPSFFKVSPSLQGSKKVYLKSGFSLTYTKHKGSRTWTWIWGNMGLKNTFMKCLEVVNKGFDE